MKFVHFLKSKCESMRKFICLKRVKFLTDDLNYRVIPELKMSSKLDILIDSNVFAYAVTHESVWVTTRGKKIFLNQPSDGGYLARVPVHSRHSKSEIYKNIKYLFPLSYLAKQGAITFCTSSELNDEMFRQPIGRFSGYRIFNYSVFKGIKFKIIDDFSGFWGVGPGIPNLKVLQQARIRNCKDQLYLDLVRVLGEKSNLDAYHIYTAEIKEMYCFMTMDLKLVRKIESLKNSKVIKNLKTKILTPADLGRYLKVNPIDTYLLSYNDADYLVRSDLFMPDEDRRSNKYYYRA